MDATKAEEKSIFSNRKKMLSFFSIAFLLLAIPLTVFIERQTTSTRQYATISCMQLPSCYYSQTCTFSVNSNDKKWCPPTQSVCVKPPQCVLDNPPCKIAAVANRYCPVHQ